ncbi:MAG TPA: hypothetical protein VIP05_33735 [Burkholderiaceae bacterium]
MSQHTSMEGLPPAIATAITRYGNAMLDAGHASTPAGFVPDAETAVAVQTRRALSAEILRVFAPEHAAGLPPLSHSPAPWRVTSAGEILDASGTLIGTLYGDQRFGDQRFPARTAGNAWLVGSSPRLLVALAECRDWMVQFLEVCAAAGLCPPPNGAETARNAKLAIDEATRTGAWASERGAKRG